MKLTLTTLFTLLLLTTSVVAQTTPETTEPEVKQTQCRVEADPRVESNRVLMCFDEDTGTEFPITISAKHPWAKFLDDAQIGVTTVLIEGREKQVCLVQVQMLDGWVPNPVNARHKASEEVCIPVKRAVKTLAKRK